MTYEKTFQGAHRISAMVGSHRVSMQYFFCTKKEAIAQFKDEFKLTRKAT